MRYLSHWRAAALALGLGAVGCGGADGGPRYDVSGKITFDGKPVRAGRVMFDPVPNKNEAGLQGWATVKDGEYSTKFEGCKGPSPGQVMARLEGLGDPAPGYPGGKPLFLDVLVRLDVNGPTTEDFKVGKENAAKLPDKPPEAP